jgi:hypothetical protein
MWALTLFLYTLFKKFVSFRKESTKSERQQIIKRTKHLFGGKYKHYFFKYNTFVVKICYKI